MPLGSKSYCQPVPCDRGGPHDCNREGFFHCSGCNQDRPRWDFYTNRETGARIEGGCRECRQRKGRGGGLKAVVPPGDPLPGRGRPGRRLGTGTSERARRRSQPKRLPARNPETGRWLTGVAS